MIDWLSILKTAAPHGHSDILEGTARAMPELISHWEINTKKRQCQFLAQVAHESGGFRYVREIWGPTAAQRRYEGRRDLGNTRRGDGKRFLGRGLIQLTGRHNYQAVSSPLGVDFTQHPQELEQFPYAAGAAAWFWNSRHLSLLADRDDIRSITRRVNGGFNGYTDRKAWLARFEKLVPDVADAQDASDASSSAQDDGSDQVSSGSAPDDILPREKIKALQAKLNELGYHCTADGLVGTQTAGAIGSFQHDNDIPASNVFDAATQEALWTAEPRAIPPERATGLPDHSRILSHAKTLQTGALGLMGAAGINASSDPISQVEAANSYWQRIKTALAPFHWASEFIAQHWLLAIVAVGGAVWAYGRKIELARVEDHQTGKTA